VVAATWAWIAGHASSAIASRGHGCATSLTIYASGSTLPLQFMIWPGTFTSRCSGQRIATGYVIMSLGENRGGAS